MEAPVVETKYGKLKGSSKKHEGNYFNYLRRYSYVIHVDCSRKYVFLFIYNNITEEYHLSNIDSFDGFTF